MHAYIYNHSARFAVPSDAKLLSVEQNNSMFSVMFCSWDNFLSQLRCYDVLPLPAFLYACYIYSSLTCLYNPYIFTTYLCH